MRRSLNYYHKNILYKYYEIFLHSFTHLFVTNSQAARLNMIEKEYVKKKNVILINNYIEKFNNNSSKIKKEKVLKFYVFQTFMNIKVINY